LTNEKNQNYGYGIDFEHKAIRFLANIIGSPVKTEKSDGNPIIKKEECAGTFLFMF